MRLTTFIQQHREAIIEEWTEFASTLLPWAKGQSESDLRDHAAELLTAVVSDMKAPQSNRQQEVKSHGLSVGSALASIGQRHAIQRMNSGFNLDQLVSEYRALRASILRQWAGAHGDKQGEMTRFNEAIDESLSEATLRFSGILDHTREQFLAILGHDLRNPLAAIAMGAALLTKSEGVDDKQARVAMRILNSAGRMNRMVGDLLDLTRTRLGSGIPVTTKRMDLAPVCQQIMSEFQAIEPDRHLRFESKGDLLGEWDSDRLSQVISNLVANALHHGRKDGPVRVVAKKQNEEVVIRVHNEGSPIPKSAMRNLFEPMVRHPSQNGETNTTGLGLGLYIARELVTAHGGTIGVISTKKGGTAFTVRIPRRPSARKTPSADS